MDLPDSMFPHFTTQSVFYYKVGKVEQYRESTGVFWLSTMGIAVWGLVLGS